MKIIRNISHQLFIESVIFTLDTRHAGIPADIRFITRQKKKAAKNT